MLTRLSDPEAKWLIGHFGWVSSGEFPYTIVKDYWHFPYLSERYHFATAVVDAQRETEANQPRTATPK